MGFFDEIQTRLQTEWENGVANTKKSIEEHLQTQFANETVKLAGVVTGQQVQVVNPQTQGAAPTVGAAVEAVKQNSGKIGIMIAAAAAAWFFLGGKKGKSK